MHDGEQHSDPNDRVGRVARLRAVVRSDLDRAVELNEAAVPAVNSVPKEFFAGWLEAVKAGGSLQPFFLAAEASAGGAVGEPSRGEALGFVLTLPPGCAYESLNYRWFSARYEKFLYVDRIVVDTDQRGLGLGRLLYDAVAMEARRRGLERVCCEVNLKPRNEGSLRFHDRHGFHEVGRQATEGGSKEVSLQVLEVAGEQG